EGVGGEAGGRVGRAVQLRGSGRLVGGRGAGHRDAAVVHRREVEGLPAEADLPGQVVERLDVTRGGTEVRAGRPGDGRGEGQRGSRTARGVGGADLAGRGGRGRRVLAGTGDIDAVDAQAHRAHGLADVDRDGLAGVG